MSFIKPDDIWALWTILIVFVAISIYLEQNYKWASKLTGPIIGLILAIIASNTNFIPIESPVYDSVYTYCVPVSVALLLLKSDIRKIFKETGQAIKAFHIGALGTLVGSFLAYFIFKNFLPEAAKMSAVMTGSYTGGGVNLFALVDTYKPSSDILGAYIVADNVIMAIFIFLCLTIPGMKWFRKRYNHPHETELEKLGQNEGKTNAASYWKPKSISIMDIAISLACAFIIATISTKISAFITANTSGFIQTFFGNMFIVLTTITLIVASAFPKFFNKINGTEEIGTFLIYLFFVVIGVPAKLWEVLTKSPILFVFCFVVAGCCLLSCLLLGKLFKLNIEELTLACNANLGGPSSAAAMAIAKGWNQLVVPGLLIGLWGYVIGTYLGVFVGTMLGL